MWYPLKLCDFILDYYTRVVRKYLERGTQEDLRLTMEPKSGYSKIFVSPLWPPIWIPDWTITVRHKLVLRVILCCPLSKIDVFPWVLLLSLYSPIDHLCAVTDIWFCFCRTLSRLDTVLVSVDCWQSTLKTYRKFRWFVVNPRPLKVPPTPFTLIRSIPLSFSYLKPWRETERKKHKLSKIN